MATPRTLTISSGVSDSMAVFGTTVNTALAGLGTIALQDATYRTVLLTNGSRVMTLTVLYWPGGGQVVTATVITASEGTSLSATVNAYFAANPTLIPQFLFDISPEDPRLSPSDGVMVLSGTSAATVLQPVVVRNLTGVGIASGATGSLTVLAITGPTAQVISGVNMGDASWGNQREGYCAFDAASGTWLCAPHCCPGGGGGGGGGGA